MRLFVAVNLPPEVRDRMAAVQDQLRRAQADVSWVRAENVHVTVKFLGETEEKRLERIRPAHALVLEANHDVKMLQDCPNRPWSLKQRILGRHGHLSNEAAADAAEQIMSAELRHLYLGHLSRECNRPELAHRVVSDRLRKIGATHVRLELTTQAHPCQTLSL